MSFEYNEEIFDEIYKVGDEIYHSKENLPLNKIIERIELANGVPMHAPYHHSILPYTLLIATAIKENMSEKEYLVKRDKIFQRGRSVPGGFCGNCGACGAGVGAGIFVSVYTGASPLTRDNWKLANEATAHSLLALAEYPGPRCCKRTCYLSLRAARDYIEENLGLSLNIDDDIKCIFYKNNSTCIKEECPFYPA